MLHSLLGGTYFVGRHLPQWHTGTTRRRPNWPRACRCARLSWHRDDASCSPCRAHRSPRRRARRAAGRPAARPVRRGTGAGPGTRRGSAGSASGSRTCSVAVLDGQAGRGVRGGGVRSPGSLISEISAISPEPSRRSVVAGRPGVAAQPGRHRLLARRTLVPHAGNAPGSLRRGSRGGNVAVAEGIRWRAGSPGCSPRTRTSVRSCWPTGWTANRVTSTPIWPGSRSCGERWRRSSPPIPRTSATEDRRPAAGGPDRPARAAVAVRAHPVGAHRRGATRRVVGPSRPAPVVARIPATSCGGGLRRCAWRRATTQRPSRCAAHHPLLQTLGRDLRELQRSLPADRATDEYLGVQAAATTSGTLLGWLQSDIAANVVGRRAANWPTVTARCRCTAATARRGRSTCSVKCYSGCWKTTRRWSPATSWSCAPTSRRTPR